jgi:hypothetical protein
MRASMFTGVLLAIAVVLVIAVSSTLELQIEQYALAGVLAGAVIGLVADRSPWARLLAFAVGFVAAWVGFVLRAALLPDTAGGRAAAAVITLVICLVAVAIGRGTRLPMWATFLGVLLFAAAYEAGFLAAEPEVATTSLDAATSLLAAVAVGYAVAVLSTGTRVDATPRVRTTEAGATDATTEKKVTL